MYIKIDRNDILKHAKEYYIETRDSGVRETKRDDEGYGLQYYMETSVKFKGIRPKELARILDMTYIGVYHWIQLGMVEWWKDGGKLWIDVDSVLLYLSDGSYKKQKMEAFCREIYSMMEEDLRNTNQWAMDHILEGFKA